MRRLDHFRPNVSHGGQPWTLRRDAIRTARGARRDAPAQIIHSDAAFDNAGDGETRSHQTREMVVTTRARERWFLLARVRRPVLRPGVAPETRRSGRGHLRYHRAAAAGWSALTPDAAGAADGAAPDAVAAGASGQCRSFAGSLRSMWGALLPIYMSGLARCLSELRTGGVGGTLDV